MHGLKCACSWGTVYDQGRPGTDGPGGPPLSRGTIYFVTAPIVSFLEGFHCSTVEALIDTVYNTLIKPVLLTKTSAQPNLMIHAK